MIFSFITTKSIYTIVYIVKSANVRLLACYVMVILWVCYGYPMVRTATHYSIRRYCVVAVWSRCGRDVVTMWSRCGGVIGPMRHASAMHPIVTFRMRTRCERWRMLSRMRHTRRIRETYGTIATSKKAYSSNKPPPLMMGGGGD